MRNIWSRGALELIAPCNLFRPHSFSGNFDLVLKFFHMFDATPIPQMQTQSEIFFTQRE